MDKMKKFIVVQSESMANHLIAHGFLLLSNVCGTYTFANCQNNKLDFSSFDNTKFYFTNKLFI